MYFHLNSYFLDLSNTLVGVFLKEVNLERGIVFCVIVYYCIEICQQRYRSI